MRMREEEKMISTHWLVWDGGRRKEKPMITRDKHQGQEGKELREVKGDPQAAPGLSRYLRQQQLTLSYNGHED